MRRYWLEWVLFLLACAGFIGLVLVLNGCKTMPIEPCPPCPPPQVVEVPLPVPCTPPTVTPPDLWLPSLPKDAKPVDVERARRHDAAERERVIRELMAALEACKAK